MHEMEASGAWSEVLWGSIDPVVKGHDPGHYRFPGSMCD